mmetsp:Transcript_35596/g.85894  ORF Transcript_35596/g.85894 Transcript_35596/m.85894 type:complete len:283 (-) Transcript_35596:382-1230(-)
MNMQQPAISHDDFAAHAYIFGEAAIGDLEGPTDVGDGPKAELVVGERAVGHLHGHGAGRFSIDRQQQQDIQLCFIVVASGDGIQTTLAMANENDAAPLILRPFAIYQIQRGPSAPKCHDGRYSSGRHHVQSRKLHAAWRPLDSKVGISTLNDAIVAWRRFGATLDRDVVGIDDHGLGCDDEDSAGTNYEVADAGGLAISDGGDQVFPDRETCSGSSVCRILLLVFRIILLLVFGIFQGRHSHGILIGAGLKGAASSTRADTFAADDSKNILSNIGRRERTIA